MTHQFHTNKKYRVTAEGFVLIAISNQTFKHEIEKEGFAQVEVTGQGVKRVATGIWPLPSQHKKLPPVVASVIKNIEEI